MGNGGGIITRKLLFALLLVTSLSLIGITSASAVNIETAQSQTVNASTMQEKVNTQPNNTNNANESATTQNSANTNVKISQTANISQTSDNTQKPEAAAGDAKTINTQVTSTSFTTNEINDAAARVKSYIETNHSLPNYVTIGTTQVKISDFLKLLTAGLLQLNSEKITPITLKSVNAPTQPCESITSGNINKADYLDLAKRVNTFIDTNGVLPNYATSTLGKLRYESLIYMYSKILNYYKTNKVLPNYVTVKAWTSIANSVLTGTRPVYITSDNINGVTKDQSRINTIINGLKALGLTAVNWGLGPNTHYTALKDSKIPANALVVNIYGGACAGTIYEMGLSYYKKLVGTKKVFSVWVPPATNITGLAWLPRSKDDNFSSSSFKGLANPDQYLLNNGYHYIYSGDLNAIITSIYKEATTV